jgi:BirA family biotin operon repressor/biotin-[acetyl-CoA-carboxylase] ligase
VQFSPIRKKLLQILADGGFQSGSDLAAAVGMSRSAVWKQLNALSNLGVEILAVSGKGYRLRQPMQLLNRGAILQAFDAPTAALLASLEVHDRIPSTNGYLMELAHGGAPRGLVCLSESQSAGKGRRGRTWASPYGGNIYLSLLWRYQGGPGSVIGLSLAAGAASVRVLRGFGVSDVGLKWPNDMYWQDAKLGGILVEVSGETNGPCAVVLGIGLNLYLAERDAQGITQAWTDLTAATGHNPPPRNALAAALINALLPLLAGFDNAGIEAYVDEWRSYDCMCGKAVSLYVGDECCDGIVVGIDDRGLLLLQQTDGKVRSFASGEVSFRR